LFERLLEKKKELQKEKRLGRDFLTMGSGDPFSTHIFWRMSPKKRVNKVENTKKSLNEKRKETRDVIDFFFFPHLPHFLQ
jgi:hypothetical protein